MVTPSNNLKKIEFDNTRVNMELKFWYSDTTGNTYLRKLRKNYGLETLVLNLPDEIEKIKNILDWAHHQWEHNGSNTPSKSDALTILKEAKEGNKFRCVEYGIVAAAGLNSIGIKSRVLGLKTKDCEKVKYGAGHVVTEAYSKEFKKWIFIDGQFNAIPFLNHWPLNAVEFQKAILEKPDSLIIVNKNGQFSDKDKKKYIDWIGKYLFYFDTKFDNRYVANKEKQSVKGKKNLMLVPLKSNSPEVFQRKFDIDYCLYTHNENDFYQTPN